MVIGICSARYMAKKIESVHAVGIVASIIPLLVGCSAKLVNISPSMGVSGPPAYWVEAIYGGGGLDGDRESARKTIHRAAAGLCKGTSYRLVREEVHEPRNKTIGLFQLMTLVQCEARTVPSIE